MKLIPDAVNPLAWAGWLCELWQTPMLRDWDVPINGADELAEAEACGEVWGPRTVWGPINPAARIAAPAVPAADWLHREVRTALDKHVVFFGLADWGCECRQHFATHQAWRDHLADIVTKILEQ